MRKKIDWLLERVLVFLMAMMVINITWQVISRYVFQSPSNYTEEISSYMMVWMCFLGGSYLFGKKLHPSIDFLVEKFSIERRKMIEYFIDFMLTVFTIFVLLIGGLRLVYVTYILDQRSAATNLPIAIVYGIIPISGIFMLIYIYLKNTERVQQNSSSEPQK